MPDTTIFGIRCCFTLILWVIVLVIYSKWIETVDFGSVPAFAGKTLLLVALVVLVIMYVPYGYWLSLLVWWLGVMILFRMDAWQAKMLVALVWIVNVVLNLALRAVLMNVARRMASSA